MIIVYHWLKSKKILYLIDKKIINRKLSKKKYIHLHQKLIKNQKLWILLIILVANVKYVKKLHK